MPRKTDQDNKIVLYNLNWDRVMDPAARELEMIRRGGQWQSKTGRTIGNGLAFHYKQLAKLLWPELVWHKWADLQVEQWVKHRCVVIVGPASSGKTCISGAICHLIAYYAFPSSTTILCCSTTKERLEDRVWGEIKSWHRLAKERKQWLPGHVIEGRMRITTDPKQMSSEGREFRNGCIGVPVLRGGELIGLSSFIGIKNKHLFLLADELSLLPKVFIDALSNLDKNTEFKVTGLGNPKDTTDALGVLAEPAVDLGGWEGGIDQESGTKCWRTKRPGGVCIQLWGPDSPNLDGKLGIPLITREQMDRDIAFYGRDSLQVSMMNEGRMPRGQGARRVLTRQMCVKFGAMKEPTWKDINQTRIVSLDAAYRSVGGDRCVLAEMWFGKEAVDPQDIVSPNSLAQDWSPPAQGPSILSLMNIRVVPIKANSPDLPEDQIVQFVMAYCRERSIPPEHFFFDAGMRTSLVSAFSRLWSPGVQSVDFMGRADDVPVSTEITQSCKDYYFNKITQVWFDVRLIVEAGQFRGMTEDVVLEFSSREWMMVGANKIQVEPKDKMKSKVGRSPDLADCVAIGAHGARKLGFTISRWRPPPIERNGPNWRGDIRRRATEFNQIGALSFAV